MQSDPTKIAILIDVENVPVEHIKKSLEQIKTLGLIKSIRAYADWSTISATTKTKWTQLVNHYAIETIQHFKNAQKNSSDFSLIIDAMDLLYSKEFACFCIISSDSDFQQLAIRIRQDGVQVYGYGEEKTPKIYQIACNKFTVLKSQVAPQKTDQTKKATPKQLKDKNIALTLIQSACTQCESKDGWIYLGTLAKTIKGIEERFSTKDYGHATLSKLLKACPTHFELDNRNSNVRLLKY
ncbi:NYN domain-containing protein [Neisseria sp. Ec49-e6-T10]|uniref:NYN domain-containing protein n=1 Tax=Neisseria sp. Ec49-e6-T10 TaxID=3140744 RepID=UPI003EBB5353